MGLHGMLQGQLYRTFTTEQFKQTASLVDTQRSDRSGTSGDVREIVAM
jgi:hypothetical protein